jgi:hypothetical protein
MQPNIPALLRTFAEQRPGLEFGNYGDIKAYRAESRSITRDLHDARTILAACDNLAPEHWAEGFRAFSGRLTLTTRDDGSQTLGYCTGQYFPTEYRRAVCAVAASALWAYHRADAATGGEMRAKFRRIFGARLQRRWFN